MRCYKRGCHKGGPRQQGEGFGGGGGWRGGERNVWTRYWYGEKWSMGEWRPSQIIGLICYLNDPIRFLADH